MAVRKRYARKLDTSELMTLNDYWAEMVDAINNAEWGMGRYHELTVTIPNGYVAGTNLVAISHNLRKTPEGWLEYRRTGGTCGGMLQQSSWNSSTVTFSFSANNASGSDLTIYIRLF